MRNVPESFDTDAEEELDPTALGTLVWTRGGPRGRNGYPG